MRERIKKYWDDRAKLHLSNPAATTDDIHLRDLEIAAIIQTLIGLNLSSESCVLDIGCGNGYSTMKVAEHFPGMRFYGIDYSEEMIDAARNLPGNESRVVFSVGDVLDLKETCHGVAFDVVISDRCLINLESVIKQRDAIAQIAGYTRPGGVYIGIENFSEGHQNMNRVREAIGLPEIPIRWHNLYFEEEPLRKMIAPYFSDLTFKDFASAYYYATRVVYSKMCQVRGEPPDYDHDIHRLAVNLPSMGQYSPIRMMVMHRNAKN